MENQESRAKIPDASSEYRPLRLITLFGAAGLLVATAADALAVAARHLGHALSGAVEITQAGMVVSSTMAMIIATATDRHAKVHFLTKLLSHRSAAGLSRACSLVSGAVMLALAAGSAWVAYDLWNDQEVSDILRIEIRWERLIWVLAALAVALVFILKRPSRQGGGDGA